MKRIVPERSSVQYDATSVAGSSSSSAADGNGGGGGGGGVSLPVPMEDYRTRQAIDGSSMVGLRLLCITSSVSLQRSVLMDISL